MTPNPQNIGAAPEEYPIRALVRSGRRFRILTVGEIIQPGDVALDKQFDFEGGITGGIPTMLYGFKVEATDGNHYYRPTPSPDAVGVPEAKPKGPSPSEVPQPGEGVDLEAIEARCKAASPGPWVTCNPESAFKNWPIGFFSLGRDEAAEPKNWAVSTDHVRASEMTSGGSREDAEFIAHARQDIPALIAEVRSLRAALGKAGA